MKTVLYSDFCAIRLLAIRQLIALLLISAFIGIFSGWTVMVAIIIFVMPFSLVYTLLAQDEASGWQSFRAALPVTRTSTVVGHYIVLGMFCAISVILAFLMMLIFLLGYGLLSSNPVFADIGSIAFMWFGIFGLLGATSVSLLLIAMAVTLPIAIRVGLNRVVRIVPVLMIFFIAVGSFLIYGQNPLAVSQSVLAFASSSVGAAAMLAASFALYAVSCLVAIRLYKTKEL